MWHYSIFFATLMRASNHTKNPIITLCKIAWHHKQQADKPSLMQASCPIVRLLQPCPPTAQKNGVQALIYVLLAPLKQGTSHRRQVCFAGILLGQYSNAPNPFGCSFLLIDKRTSPPLKAFLSINKNRAIYPHTKRGQSRLKSGKIDEVSPRYGVGVYIKKEAIINYLKRNLRGGEVVIIMGAGDIYELVDSFK